MVQARKDMEWRHKTRTGYVQSQGTNNGIQWWCKVNIDGMEARRLSQQIRSLMAQEGSFNVKSEQAFYTMMERRRIERRRIYFECIYKTNNKLDMLQKTPS